MAIMKRYLAKTASVMGTGQPSPVFCELCVDSGIHSQPWSACDCPCHDARRLIHKFDANANQRGQKEATAA